PLFRSRKAEDVDRAAPGADLVEPVSHRLGCDLSGTGRCVLETVAAREQGSERGGVGAAGAVRRLVPVSLHGDRYMALPVEQPVDRVESMPAGHDHGGRAQAVNSFGERLPVGVLRIRDAGKGARLLAMRLRG